LFVLFTGLVNLGKFDIDYSLHFNKKGVHVFKKLSLSKHLSSYIYIYISKIGYIIGTIEIVFKYSSNNINYVILPPFQNIRCFSFVKQMYLDIF
jgi:hypothetical protein